MDFVALKVNDKLVEILKSKKIEQPTEIQAKTFALAANGHDVIGVSQTGSGKTLAFLLPILDQILKSDKPFHTLILTPTRELAIQTSDCIMLFEELGIRQSLLVGGENFNPQVASINKHPHIIIGTPGRVAKHIIKTKNLRIDSVRKLILDEADRFFEQDFEEDLEIISKRLKRKNQTLMFTATITDKTQKLSSIFMRNPRIIETASKYEPLKTLVEQFALIPEKYKLTVLYNYLLQQNGIQTIVFVSMCASSLKVGTVLQDLGLSCEYLHGSMPQNKREEVIKNFKSDKFHILISTDVASRGLDIPHVELIINYDLPGTAKDYVHRVGRTARAGKEGRAISFVSQYDVIDLQKLESCLNRTLEKVDMKLYDNYDKVKECFEDVNAQVNENDQLKKRSRHSK